MAMITIYSLMPLSVRVLSALLRLPQTPAALAPGADLCRCYGFSDDRNPAGSGTHRHTCFVHVLAHARRCRGCATRQHAAWFCLHQRVTNRERTYRWLLSLKAPNGGFFMHHNGEIDVRGTYTALAVASMLNILTPELTEGCSEFLESCQSYEGGYGVRKLVLHAERMLARDTDGVRLL